MPFTIFHITDTHWGAPDDAWGRHPTRPDLLPELFARLDERMREAKADLLVHGGDLVHSATQEEQAAAAAQLDRLSVPTLLALGNHDLVDSGAYPSWSREFQRFLPGGRGDYLVGCEGADVVVLANQWTGPGEQPAFFWDHDTRNDPVLTEQQLNWLDSRLQGSDRPVVVVLHAALFGAEPERTGLEQVEDEAPEDYRDSILRVLDRHKNVRLVLTGHRHFTAAWDRGHYRVLATAAFCEPPFHYRVIELDPDRQEVRVDTRSAADPEEVNALMDPSAAWTTGAESDRTFPLPW
jgi:3',5'-cyclic AMP phosphodiesterase CpdA